MGANPFDMGDRDFNAVVRVLEANGLRAAPDVRPDPPKPSVSDLDEQIQSIRDSQMAPARVSSARSRVQEANKVAAERAAAAAAEGRRADAAARNRSAKAPSAGDGSPRRKAPSAGREGDGAPKRRRVKYNIKMVDADTGRVLRNVMGAKEGDLSVSGGDMPPCYEMMNGATSASVVEEGEAVAYMRFRLPDDMVPAVRAAAADAVMAAPLAGDAHDMIASAFSAAAEAVRAEVSERCRFTMDGVEVVRGQGGRHGSYGESVVSSFLYASSAGMPESEVVRKSVVRSLDRTDLVKQLSYPSLGRVIVCSATIYDTEVPSEVFKDVRHKGVACDLAYEKTGHRTRGK